METKGELKRILIGVAAIGVAVLFSTCADPMKIDFAVPEPKPIILDPAIKQFSINGPDGVDLIGSGMISYPKFTSFDGTTLNTDGKKDLAHLPDYGLTGRITATVSYNEIQKIWNNTSLDSNTSRGQDANKYKRITFVPRFETDSKLIMDHRLYSSGNKVGDIHQALRAIMPESTGNNPGLVDNLIVTNPTGAVGLIQGEFRKKRFNFGSQFYLAQNPPLSANETSLAGDTGNYMSIDIGVKSGELGYNPKFDPATMPYIIDVNSGSGTYFFVIYSLSREGYVAKYELLLTVQTISSNNVVTTGSPPVPTAWTGTINASAVGDSGTGGTPVVSASDFWVQKDYTNSTRSFSSSLTTITGPVNIIGGFEGHEQSASGRNTTSLTPAETTITLESDLKIEGDALFLQDITIKGSGKTITVGNNGKLVLKNAIVELTINIEAGGELVIQDGSGAKGQSLIKGIVKSKGNVALIHGSIEGSVELEGGDMTISSVTAGLTPLGPPENEIKATTAGATGITVGPGAKLTMHGGKISGYDTGIGVSVESKSASAGEYGIFYMDGGEILNNGTGVLVGRCAMFNKKAGGTIQGTSTIVDATLEGQPGLMQPGDAYATDIPAIAGTALKWTSLFGSGRDFNGFSATNPPPVNSAILGSAPTKADMKAVPIMLGSASLISSSTIGSADKGKYFVFYGPDRARFNDASSISVFTNGSGLNDRAVLYFSGTSLPGESSGSVNIVIARGANLSHGSGVTPTVNTLENVGGNLGTGTAIWAQVVSHDALEITLGAGGEFVEQDELNKYVGPSPYYGTGLGYYLFSIDPQVSGKGIDHLLTNGKIRRDNGTQVTITELTPLMETLGTSATDPNVQKVIVNAAAIRVPSTYGSARTVTTAGNTIILTPSSWGSAGSESALNLETGGTYLVKANNVWHSVNGSGSVSSSSYSNLGSAISASDGLASGGTTIGAGALINGHTYDIYRIYNYLTGTTINLDRNFGNSIVVLSSLASGAYNLRSAASTRAADVKVLLYTGGTSGTGTYSIPSDLNGSFASGTTLATGSYYRVGNQYWAYKIKSEDVSPGDQPKLSFNATDNYSTLSSFNQVSNKLNLTIDRGLLLAQGGYGRAEIDPNTGLGYIGTLDLPPDGSHVVKVTDPTGSVTWLGIHSGMLSSGGGPIGGAFEPTTTMNQKASGGTIKGFPMSPTSYYSAYQFKQVKATDPADGSLDIGTSSGNVFGQAVYLSDLNPDQDWNALKTGTSGVVIQTLGATPNLPTEVVIATGFKMGTSGEWTLGSNNDEITREYQEIGIVGSSGIVFNDTSGNYSDNIKLNISGSDEKYFTIKLPANTTSFKTSVVPAPEDVSAGMTPSNGTTNGSVFLPGGTGGSATPNGTYIGTIDKKATVTLGTTNFKLKVSPLVGSFFISNGSEVAGSKPLTPLKGGTIWVDFDGSKIRFEGTDYYAITGGGSIYQVYGSSLLNGTYGSVGSRVIPDSAWAADETTYPLPAPYGTSGTSALGTYIEPGTPKVESLIPASALKRKTPKTVSTTSASITLGE